MQEIEKAIELFGEVNHRADRERFYETVLEKTFEDYDPSTWQLWIIDGLYYHNKAEFDVLCTQLNSTQPLYKSQHTLASDGLHQFIVYLKEKGWQQLLDYHLREDYRYVFGKRMDG